MFLVEKNKLSLLGLINNYNEVHKIRLCAMKRQTVFCNAAPHDGEKETSKVSLLGFPLAPGEFPANTDIKTELKVTALSQISAACLGEISK